MAPEVVAQLGFMTLALFVHLVVQRRLVALERLATFCIEAGMAAALVAPAVAVAELRDQTETAAMVLVAAELMAVLVAVPMLDKAEVVAAAQV